MAEEEVKSEIKMEKQTVLYCGGNWKNKKKKKKNWKRLEKKKKNSSYWFIDFKKIQIVIVQELIKLKKS